MEVVRAGSAAWFHGGQHPDGDGPSAALIVLPAVGVISSAHAGFDGDGQVLSH